MIIDKTFQSEYQFEVLYEMPAGIDTYYYPGASTLGGKDGILVKIYSKERGPWVGVFAFGDISGNCFSGIVTTPDSNKICIISNGAGYFVSTLNPMDWRQIDAFPIIDVKSIFPKNVIVFADYIKLTAYDKTMMKWMTQRLAWQEFHIIETTDDYITGEYYDIRSEEDRTFKVDLSSGLVMDPTSVPNF